MKESMFNIYLVDEKEQKYLVFNTLSKSLVQIDSEVYTLMTQNRIDEMDDTGLRALRKERIIVGDSVNELDMLKIIINRGRFDGTSVGVTVIPTHACNLACTYCYQGHGDVLSNTMSDETVRRTIEFIKKLDVDTCQFSNPIVYPGTKLFEEAKENNWLRFNEGDWEKFDMTEPTLKNEEFSPEEIMGICQSAWKQIYFRPKYLLKRVCEIRNLDSIKSLYRGARSVYYKSHN